MREIVSFDGKLFHNHYYNFKNHIIRFQIRESDRLARKIVATRGRSVYDPSSATNSKKSSNLIRSKNEERSTLNYGRGNNGPSKEPPKTRLPTSQCAKTAPKRASTIPTPIKTPGKPLASPYAAAGGQSVGLRGRRPLGVPRVSCHGSTPSAAAKRDLVSSSKIKGAAGARTIAS